MVAVTGLGADVIELEQHGELFAEFPGRFVMATSDLEAFRTRADAAGVPVHVLGTVRGHSLRIGQMIDLSVDELSSRRRSALEESLASLG
ncbi:MAG TPA: hypothetical protein VIJ99_06960, partial [Acidimicrobiales bacterium]